MSITSNSRAKLHSVHLDSYRSLLRPLSYGLVAALLATIFVHLGNEAMEGETRSFDLHMLHFAQSLRSSHPWVSEAMRDLSGLGSATVLGLFTAASVGYLCLVPARSTALLVAASVIAGALLIDVLKAAFGRLRPDAAYADFLATGLSFPSGHSSMSAIVFLTVGTLLASQRSRLAERSYILATASVMTLLIGLSRIALGVHWATDVLGGWAFGAAWAMAWLMLDRQIATKRME